MDPKHQHLLDALELLHRTETPLGWRNALRDILNGEGLALEVKPPETPEPVPMLLWCPLCHARHLDEGVFATKPHTSHSCQSCGLTWRPALVPTVGVQFLPGYKNP